MRTGMITEDKEFKRSLHRIALQTRIAIEELSVSQDGALNVKHRVLGDAAIFAFDDSLLVIRVRDGRRWV